ncbi:hypothetical protein CONPUDRAFT_156114 [Coniophora puteana RWD-64-598 SS2]|uniref:HMG box domain-containing protein n=1 Tax=Coniophora puteana (strain RWD-64-598) TaxID=741705 RepID=A0A5M3MG15_CONPW|nr:uncharacterized protein CONPUDRAFT_156114 [Coniophora puteana RWD-64-598 SS2]EIW78103.1 hypothetical protein CONPUDRAFT_156114 [Coniophora puteana RWD-64-598 SS2]
MPLLSDHLTTIPHLNPLIAPGAGATSLADALGASLTLSPPIVNGRFLTALHCYLKTFANLGAALIWIPLARRIIKVIASSSASLNSSGFISSLPSTSLNGNAISIAAPSLLPPHEYALPGPVIIPVTSTSAFTNPPDQQRLIFAGKQLGRMSLRQPRKLVKTLQMSVLKPPRLAPSAAKEAGHKYAELSAAEKEPYKHKSAALKQERERQNTEYMKTLTPDNIKRENAYRTAQRKASKSRKSNLKDPNTPKKPLIFGNKQEMMKQSVLTAGDEHKPLLARAEQEKLKYEAARRLYEEGTPALGTNINFSILPQSTDSPFSTIQPIKTESFGSFTSDG